MLRAAADRTLEGSMTPQATPFLPAVLVASLLAASSASAQIGGSGSIQGTILDHTGAVVPGATVTAINLATGVETRRVTTGAGVYAVSPLSPGVYRVEVRLDGFQPYAREPVIVDALAVVGLNVTLQLSGVAQEIMVQPSHPRCERRTRAWARPFETTSTPRFRS